MKEATILCLDDEAIGLAVRAAVLRCTGYAVFTASSTEEALRILMRQHIDIVICDYLLPGTTGTEIAASIKRIKPRVRVLILSGLIELPEEMVFADCFLSKLEPPPVLLATVAKLLTEPEAGFSVA